MILHWEKVTIIFQFDCYVEKPTQTETFNYLKGDYESMNQELENTNWVKEMDILSKTASVESYWSKIKEELYELRDKFVPKVSKTCAPHWSSKGTVSLDSKTRVALKEKKKFRKWIKSVSNLDSNRDRNQIEYNKARNKVKSLVSQS